MDTNKIILDLIYNLISAYKEGKLGGEKMPEDENPHLNKSSKENYMYFTLPMALNYQRNSYKLWESANKMYWDNSSVFDSKSVCQMKFDELKNLLVKHKVALQPNKQPVIWKALCETIENKLDGDIRNLFSMNQYSVSKVKEYIAENKKCFPYIGGNKICNYWLYVIEQYTNCRFTDRENITVAPDTHIIQASEKLGIITSEERQSANVQLIVAERWKELLKETELVQIDIHTPMWLWSRGKFTVEI